MSNDTKITPEIFPPPDSAAKIRNRSGKMSRAAEVMLHDSTVASCSVQVLGIVLSKLPQLFQFPPPWPLPPIASSLFFPNSYLGK